MNSREAMGGEGMVFAVLASIAMIVTARIIGTPHHFTGDAGLCLRSPNEWILAPVAGWILNIGIIGVSILTLYILDKTYHFIPGPDTVLIGLFAIMVTSNPWLTEMLSSSAIMAFANMLCLLMLFGCYRKQNASQELCVIATILSLGSMIQYGFIFMIPVYLIGSAALKCLRFKSFVAFIMGLVAPYWVGIGLGLLPFDSFKIPHITNLFNGFENQDIIFIELINIGLTALTGFVLTVGNMVKLYAGNTQRRLNNAVINLLGLVSLICIIIDSTNMVAYLTTLYIVAAIQFANMFALRNIYHSGRWAFLICLLYISGFIAMVTLQK